MTDMLRMYLLLKGFGLLDKREVYDAKKDIVYTDNTKYALKTKALSEHKEKNDETR